MSGMILFRSSTVLLPDPVPVLEKSMFTFCFVRGVFVPSGVSEAAINGLPALVAPFLPSFQESSQERELPASWARFFRFLAPSTMAFLRLSMSPEICEIIASFSELSPRPTAFLNLYHPSFM